MTKRFIGKKLIKSNLKKYGFNLQNNNYIYIKNIADNQFSLTVTIDKDNNLTTKLVDNSTDELYTLHLVEEASGKFIGEIRKEYNEILDSVLENCFENNVFTQDMTLKVLKYIEQEYGSKPEYLWEKYPNNAVVRHKNNKKWFGAVLSVNGKSLGLPTNDIVEVLNLKIGDVNKVIDNERYFTAYHMNKKLWISALLNNNTEFNNLKNLISESYNLTKK